jgi:hypothetical protein
MMNCQGTGFATKKQTWYYQKIKKACAGCTYNVQIPPYFSNKLLRNKLVKHLETFCASAVAYKVITEHLPSVFSLLYGLDQKENQNTTKVLLTTATIHTDHTSKQRLQSQYKQFRYLVPHELPQTIH